MTLEAAWCVRLGLAAEGFWGSTPRRVAAFFDAFAGGERAEDARFGILAAVVANVNRGRGSRAARPSDFFASLAPSEPERMSDRELRRAFLGAFGKIARRKG